MPSRPRRSLSESSESAARDARQWAQLLERHRERLRRLVARRLDVRLRGRIDPSDVLQDAFLEASRRLPEIASNPQVPIYLWLRFLVRQKLAELHRRHLVVQARDAGREVSLARRNPADSSGVSRGDAIGGDVSSPSEAAIHAERRVRVEEALNRLDPIDREILVLRHFEQLTNGEAAEFLKLDKSAASKRYARAVIRLKNILLEMPGGLPED
jgi:RNA polymerase sigma-70 factor (ECF subfamily)